eukprot:Nk52_evm5s298 gene=Nk52_evmTU5s298
MFLKICVLLVLLVGAVSAAPTPQPQLDNSADYAFKNSLIPDENLQAINDLVERFKDEEVKYAVFDWDNTNMYHDLEETFIGYMLENFLFKFDPNTIFQDLSHGILDNKTVSDYWYSSCDTCVYFNPKAQKPEKADLTDLFVRVETSYKALSAKGYLNQTKFQEAKANMQLENDRDYNDFFAVMNYLYYQTAMLSVSPEIVNSWITRWYTGYTIDELQTVFEKDLFYQIGNSLAFKPIVSPGDKKVVKSSIQFGLRPFQQQAQIEEYLRNNGFKVFIVSAASKHIAEVPANSTRLGYDFPRDHVYGLMMATDENNKILPHLDPAYPVTAGMGKSDCVRNIFKEHYPGKEFMFPAFCAGDSNGDYNMLQLCNPLTKPNASFPEWPVRSTKAQKKQPESLSMIVNRDDALIGGHDISTYYELAIEQLNSFHKGTRKTLTWLLQGQDQNTGFFISNQDTIALGETKPSPPPSS